MTVGGLSQVQSVKSRYARSKCEFGESAYSVLTAAPPLSWRFIAQEPLFVPQSSMIPKPSFVRPETCGPIPNRESSRRCRLKLPNVEGPDLSSIGRPTPFVSQPADRRIQQHSTIVSQYGLSGLLWSFLVIQIRRGETRDLHQVCVVVWMTGLAFRVSGHHEDLPQTGHK